MLSPRSPRLVCTFNCTSASTTSKSSFTHNKTRSECEKTHSLLLFSLWFSAVFVELEFQVLFLLVFFAALAVHLYLLFLFVFVRSFCCSLAHLVTYLTISHLYNYPPDQLTTTRFYETGRVSFLIYFLLLFLYFLLFLFVGWASARCSHNKVCLFPQSIRSSLSSSFQFSQLSQLTRIKRTVKLEAAYNTTKMTKKTMTRSLKR